MANELQSTDPNRYLYDFVSSSEFNDCYPTIAFHSSVLLTCVDLIEKQKTTKENMEVPILEVIVASKKRMKKWEERARKCL
ncbi:hypothetical protein SBY92_002393 [Candida maltosa Xu316]